MRTRLTAFLILASLLFSAKLMADEPPLDSLRLRADSLNAIKPVVVLAKPRMPRFSFFDSVSNRFLSPRLNLNTAVTAGRYKNPGGYLRFEPSQFVLNTSTTPVRTTVSPFGASGDRLGVVVNGEDMRPFEHVVQPDGAIDMNDIPDLSDDNIYLLPGQLGQIFGASHGVATLLTRPNSPDDTRAHTAMLVDKGAFGYSQVRGKFHTHFTDGRDILLGIGYRKADGVYQTTNDDSYHYLASIVQPVTSRISFFGDGVMYHRSGTYRTAADTSEQYVNRTRFDRNLKAGFSLQNDSGTNRMDIGYLYQRQRSDLSNFYVGRFDETKNGAFVSMEGNTRNLLFKAEATGEYEKWEDGAQFKDRVNGSLLGTVAFDHTNINTAIQVGARYAKDYDALPTFTAAASYEQPHWYLLTSIGYDQQAPSLHERFLRYKEVPFTFYDVANYADSGNADLKKEQQLVGSMLFELGSQTRALRLSVTGGVINDAIDWKRTVIDADSLALFTPINHDVQFASASVNLRQNLFTHFDILAGAAKYWYDSDSLPERLYRPEYNIFSGGEFHIYWAKTGVDLYAYGEITYCGQYSGYVRSDLGKKLVANSKLSLGMKQFRFYYGTENLFQTEYREQESYLIISRTISWGFTWQFLD